MRCPLLVPCDRPDVFEAAASSGADAIVVDLGDVCDARERATRRVLARDLLSRSLGAIGGPLLILRVAPLTSDLLDDDLDAVVAGAPDAVLLPQAVGARDVQHLAAKLAVREAEHGLPDGRTRIVVLPADTARGVIALSTLPGASPRLAAVFWDGPALARDLGAAGADSAPCRLARAQSLIAAVAAAVPAFEVAAAAPGEALELSCDAARRDGFAGLLARHPGQVSTIRERFSVER